MPDSAGTATAFLAGVKANYYTVGVNGNVKMSDCAASLKKANQVDTILKWAQDAGKATGEESLWKAPVAVIIDTVLSLP